MLRSVWPLDPKQRALYEISGGATSVGRLCRN
ncbi:hypothetical protein BKA18_000233 [Streptomyces auratus]